MNIHASVPILSVGAMRTRWILPAVLGLFLVMGSVYSLVTPIFEASDERWHYPVVRHIVRTGRLPVQDPQKRTDWHQEGSQPPLYYLIAAALTAWIPTEDFHRVYVPNPHAVVGEPLVVGNKNMMVHSAREDWPWQGTTLAVHLIRSFSVVLGGITVWLTYRIARLVWRAEERVAWLAAALTAFNPMFLFISASVNNDNLAAPLAAAAMFILLRVVQRGQRGRDGLGLGILLGLGAITKLSVLTLLPLTLGVFLWDAWRGGRQGRPNAWRDGVFNLLLIAGGIALIAGWWYWRNWTLYGDPTGLNRMLDIAGRRKEVLTWERLWYEFEGFRITYWALFGALNILADRWIYTLLDGISLLAGVGLLFTCIRLVVQQHEHKSSRGVLHIEPAALLLLIGWVVLVLIALLRWTSQTYATQGRLMFVAIAGISTLLATGLLVVVPGCLRTAVTAVVGGGLCVLAMLSPFVYIAPAYARPPLLRTAQLPADVHRVDWTVDGAMRLVGYRLEPSPATRTLPAVRPFEFLPLTVYWEALRPIDTNYSVFVHLLGRDRRVVGQVNTYPGLGLWPTTQLQPGDVVADTYRVPVAADAAAPTLVRVHVGLYRYEEAGRPGLETRNIAGERIEPWLTTVKLVPWEWPQVAPTHPMGVQLGEAIRLSGYDLVQTDGDGGPRYMLTLYWEALRRPAADYTVFIQLWDARRQVAGFDRRPLGGDYPTDWWEEGERIVDPHMLDLSLIPAGRYHLRVGMYRLDTGERLPAYDATGPLPDYAIRLEL
ncbi:MAG: glycosyltransferase family 39 protein, partial [Anaerolineae bacterium]|nr:glycosyltransferase family 39 protein [Anaerolineae bacterium]MDW8071016.1 glycosyltransferase family 39 protein [Anaerolineae bacterium]